jgi:hypothetical protein
MVKIICHEVANYFHHLLREAAGEFTRLTGKLACKLALTLLFHSLTLLLFMNSGPGPVNQTDSQPNLGSPPLLLASGGEP